ncbi:MAG TPA: DNA/RNA non-specific endonuclease [Solirubrobacterales bacterium]|nr:DNA/RNA non-specific endonuclease [Solirubrobacterales bacterium]
MGEGDLKDKAAIEAAVRKVADDYLKDPNITSVGVGYKVTGGKRTDELALQFTVGRKLAPEGLEALSTRTIPDSITVNGITLPTDVVERTFETHPVAVPVEAKPDRKRRLDPMAPGVSVGNVGPGNAAQPSAGTLGCLVQENDGGEVRMLSNWHVLHDEHGSLGDAIAQPGPFDDNRASADNVCGTLVRSFLGLAGDCAIAGIEGRAVSEESLDLGAVVRQIGDPELGDRVVKSGRTTGVTHGVVTRVHTITKIAYDGIGPKEIGSFEIGPDSDHPAENEEISMSGDSGAAWMAANPDGSATDMMLGLHFAGEVGAQPEYAGACYASSVFEKLEISPLASAPAAAIAVGGAAETGYDPRFLPGDHAVDTPTAIDDAVQDDYAPTKAGKLVRDYTHFSLAMSARRRFCRWVAWNIDGNGLQTLDRDGIPFVLDDAYEPEQQFDNDLYKDVDQKENPLDRGHIARRADLLWGTRAEAERANVESFRFPNITPQLNDFNQERLRGIWGTVETGIYEAVKVEGLKMSVFGGPIFMDTDFPFRGALIPRSFWKAIAYVEGGALRAKAYVLTQDDLENKLESVGLEEFKMYQVPIAELSELTGLGFGPLGAADTAPAGPESASAPVARRIESRSELVA